MCYAEYFALNSKYSSRAVVRLKKLCFALLIADAHFSNWALDPMQFSSNVGVYLHVRRV